MNQRKLVAIVICSTLLPPLLGLILLTFGQGQPGVLQHALVLVGISYSIEAIVLWISAFPYPVQQQWLRVSKQLQAVVSPLLLKKTVVVEELMQLREQVHRLGLALHSTTPEREAVRRTHFQLLGEPLPRLELPAQNAVLYAEFCGVSKLLHHYGFPLLERVRLQQQEVAFLKQWLLDLEARLHQQQQTLLEQQGRLFLALAAMKEQHTQLGIRHPLLCQQAGYHRLQGALHILEALLHDPHCPFAMTQQHAHKLQLDFNILSQQYEQKKEENFLSLPIVRSSTRVHERI